MNKATIKELKRHDTYTDTEQIKLLISNAKNGERTAQAALYKQYSKAMFNLCLRMLKDYHTAEDVLQEVFVRVFRNLDMYDFHSTFGAWIKRITINACINHLRRTTVLSFTDEFPEEPLDVTLEENYSAEQVQKIKLAIPQLPEGYRIVLNMYLFEGYDHAEIAEILQVSESTSKSQFHRARKKLLQLLQTV